MEIVALKQGTPEWQPTEAAAPAVAAPVESLPAVIVQVQGQLTVGSNLPAFGAALRSFIERIPTKPRTDNEFADAEAACKALKKAEDALAQAEESALAQVGDVEAMRRMVADLKALSRATRVATEKLVKAEKDARRVEIVTTSNLAFSAHVQHLEVGLKGIRLQMAPPDFAGVIKGLSSVARMEERLTAALLEGKAQANTLASRVHENLHMLDSVNDEYSDLFPDRLDLAHKDSEVLELLIHKRVTEHQAAEAARLEAERERIRAEEKQRAQADAEAARHALEQQAREQAQDLVRIAKELDAENIVQAEPLPQKEEVPDGSRVTIPLKTDSGDDETITLGRINTLLAPIRVDCAGLAELGFTAQATVKAAKHYRASDFPAICRAIAQHAMRYLDEI